MPLKFSFKGTTSEFYPNKSFEHGSGGFDWASICSKKRRKKQKFLSHNLKNSYRVNIKSIIENRFRDLKGEKQLYFYVSWEGYKIKTWEHWSSAVKSPKLMNQYLKSLSKTRIRNILKRVPEMEKYSIYNEEPCKKQKFLSHNLKNSYRVNIESIIENRFRDLKGEKQLYFYVSWEGYKIKTWEHWSSAVKSPKLMNQYLKSLSRTRIRNILKRVPEMKKYLE